MREAENMGEVEELIGTLWMIGMIKNGLPLRLRGWVNELGLYVQLHGLGGRERLAAGGKYRSYFDAWRRVPGGDWEVKKFDKETWNRRFAHLVEPTEEIAEFLVGQEGLSELDAATLKRVIQHFKTTGEWLELPFNRFKR